MGRRTGDEEPGRALAGLRVVDTATLYSGPVISTLLADHGADVVKIEPPGNLHAAVLHSWGATRSQTRPIV